jgi:hypothetical protein
LWESRTGQLIATLKNIVVCEWAADGFHFVGHLPREKKPAVGDIRRLLAEAFNIDKVSAPSPETLWADLADSPAKAYQASEWLVAHPDEARRLMKDKLRLPVVPPAKEIDSLIKNLDSDSFAVRQEARKTLSGHLSSCRKQYRAALEKSPTLEVRKALETILIGQFPIPADELRVSRCIFTLERMGGKEAVIILKSLQDSEQDSELMTLTRSAIERLSHEPIGPGPK